MQNRYSHRGINYSMMIWSEKRQFFLSWINIVSRNENELPFLFEQQCCRFIDVGFIKKRLPRQVQ